MRCPRLTRLASHACISAVRLVRADGTDAAVDEIGEIWVKGPSTTPGYRRRPEATAGAFTDGWLRTGDAALLDKDGFCYIADR